MYIAQYLRRTNAADYILYMWHIEDTLRACNLNAKTLKQKRLGKDALAPQEEEALLVWYNELIEMMHYEGITTQGHLQIVKNVVITLTDLHQKLMASSQVPTYHAAYYEALPIIVALRAKGGETMITEVETALTAIYGVFLLHASKKEVTTHTNQATQIVRQWLMQLNEYYLKDKNGELEKLLND